MTPTPRGVLTAYLSGPFRSGAPLTLNTLAASATGRQLAARIVSRLEVMAAIAALPTDCRAVIEAVFVDGESRRDTQRMLSVSDRRLHQLRNEGIDLLQRSIFDWSQTANLTASAAG